MVARRSRLPASTLKDTRGFDKRSSRFFIVRFRQNQLDRPRFAVIVGVKVDRSSVGRHRLKRRTSESLRLVSGGWDFAITILPPAKDLSRAKFAEELNQLISR